MKTTMAVVTTMILIEEPDGACADQPTLKLAAQTANMKGEAHSENIFARLISRDCRLVGTPAP